MRHSTHATARTIATAAFAIAGAALLLQPRDARACGGCFAPSESVQVVTDHRMAMSITADDAYLWDQIRFTGSPQDFAWVLPVSGEVEVQVASAEFFDELAAATDVRVQGPVLRTTCGGGFLGGFAARGAPSSADGAEQTNPGVTVIHMATVGPYETVTLRSTDAMSLTTWLQEHHYSIPSSIQPTIQFYVDRHMDFVALRLAPAETVQAMQPIRIHYATPNMTLPLRMVSAGVSDKVGITLWVFGTGRTEAMNYANATIDASQLAWNWDTSSSNYGDVFNATVRNTANGRVWITEAANSAVSFSSAQSAASMNDWALVRASDPSTWITRMRADLAARFLDGDLVLQASTRNAAVSNTLRTQIEIGTRPEPTCPAQVTVGSSGNGVACSVNRVGSAAPRSSWREATFGLAAIAGLIGAVRRRRAARHRA